VRIPLQEIGFKDSVYERPNQDWVCGWSADGNPCLHGPDGDGLCYAQAQANCSPVKEADRWVCTRAEAFGGPCTDGPQPDGSCACPTPEHLVCQPQRNIRAKRGLLTKLVTILSLGFLVLMFSGSWSQSFVSPGTLSPSHLAIEGVDGGDNCSSCHQAGNTNWSTWLSLALKGSDAENMHDTSATLCLDCHFKDDEEGLAQSHFVHGVAPSLLEKITLEKMLIDSDGAAGSTTEGRLMVAKLVYGPKENSTGEIACATCHQEHRGLEHDLRQMSDSQCQSCHKSSFNSFNDGHPQFTPVKRLNSGISFDHSKHQERFDGGDLVCGNCHEADSLGRTMNVKAFESTCEGCHEQGSDDHHGDALKKNPLLVLQLPEVEFSGDVYWPSENAFGEALTPMMAMLLAGDDEALPIIESIYDEDGAAGDLYEWLIETEDNDEPELREEFAGALKRLVADLADYTDEGDGARVTRLAKALGAVESDPNVRSMADELASANFVMQSFKQRYLPQLSEDLAGEEVSADDDEQPETQWMTSSTMSGWRVDSDEGTISYRPVSHADSMMKNWIDALKIHSTKAVPQGTDDATLARANLRQTLYSQLKNDFNACTKCHTEQDNAINWKAAGRATGWSGFAKFDHSPHIAMLPGQESCTTCHMLNTESGQEESMPKGFMPHENERCESCHAPGRANNTCLNCHQYHEHRP
jgi:hypothetical protein